MKSYTKEKGRVWISHVAYVRRLSPKHNLLMTSEIHLEAWDDSRLKRTPQQAAICFVWLLETSKKYNFWCTAQLAESPENLISDSALLYLGFTNGQMMTTVLVYGLCPPLLCRHNPSSIQFRHLSTPQQITFFLFCLPERNKFLKTSIFSSFSHLFGQILFVITFECIYFQTTVFILWWIYTFFTSILSSL